MSPIAASANGDSLRVSAFFARISPSPPPPSCGKHKSVRLMVTSRKPSIQREAWGGQARSRCDVNDRGRRAGRACRGPDLHPSRRETSIVRQPEVDLFHAGNSRGQRPGSKNRDYRVPLRRVVRTIHCAVLIQRRCKPAPGAIGAEEGEIGNIGDGEGGAGDQGAARPDRDLGRAKMRQPELTPFFFSALRRVAPIRLTPKTTWSVSCRVLTAKKS